MQIIERTNVFSEMYDKTTDFFHFRTLVLPYRLAKINWYTLREVSAFQCKVNKPNTKVSTHYCIICLYSENSFCNIFVTYKIFNLFRNMFNSEAIKKGHIITIHFTYKAIQ